MKIQLVSVIMPVYNTRKTHLLKAINSVLNQTYSNYELIIVDDGSTNTITLNFLDELKPVSNVKIITNPNNIGIAGTLNNAINLTRGSIIMRMDSDDLMHRNKIKDTVNFFLENPDIDVCGTYAITFGKYVRLLSMPKSNNMIRIAMSLFSPIIHPTSAFRNSNKIRALLYYKNVPAEDYQLWIDLARDSSIQFANIPRFLLFYRVHNHQISKKNSKDLSLDDLRIFEEAWKINGFPKKEMNTLKHFLLEKSKIDLKDAIKARNLIFKKKVLYSLDYQKDYIHFFNNMFMWKLLKELKLLSFLQYLFSHYNNQSYIK